MRARRVRIVLVPTWAKRIDFETTLLSALEDWPGSGTNASSPERRRLPPTNAEKAELGELASQAPPVNTAKPNTPGYR